jgi:hypothetical protein
LKSFVFVVALAFLILPFLAFSTDYQIKHEGTMLIFPSRDSVPDLDTDLFEIDLANIPQEFQGMMNKIYRGQYTNPSSSTKGPIVYIYLTSWHNGKKHLEFAVAQSGSGRNKGQIYGISCPRSEGEINNFSCFQQMKGLKTYSRTFWKFYTKNGLPALDCSDGWSIYNFEQVGALPESLLKK